MRGRLRAWGLWPMLRKEFIQMRRDRLTLAMMVMIPTVQLLLFGYAIRTEVRHLPTVVLDESRTTQSRDLVAALHNTGNFDITGEVRSREELRLAIERGGASAGVVIPPEFARRLKRGERASVQVLVDAADPLASSAAISSAAMVGAARTAEMGRGPGAGAATGIGPAAIAAQGAGIDVRVRPLYNPALRSEAYIVPGLIGVLLSMMMMIITSMSIVRERERGTLEQLVVTPLDKLSLMLGKVLPFVIVGYVQITLILLLGKIVFDVPLRGSLMLLYAISAAFILAMLALGLFISTVARTQAQAMQLGFFFLLPNILLSGFMFPREAMPLIAQWLGLALPLTWFLEVLRGILLKDIGIGALWPQTAVLLLFALGLIGASARRFSKTLE